MGCASSKVDDLPAVALCRERCSYLDEAINQRFILADAHIAYVESLRAVGESLFLFIQQDSSGFTPVLKLPPERKGGDLTATGAEEGASSSPKKAHLAHHSHSNSGSHLHFHSDSDDDDDSVSHIHHSDNSSPLHDASTGAGGHVQYMPSDYTGTEYSGGGFMHMNYMMNKATTPIVYEQRPMASETVHFGESSSSSSSSYYYPNNYNNPYQMNYFGYSSFGGAGGGGMGGYYGSPRYGSSSSSVMPQAAEASSSKPPPPPPPPPAASPWDFLNLFENQDNYYPPYTPSRDSKELREEEGIPDLEDENYQHEVVKKVHGHEKYVDGGGDFSSKSVMMDGGDAEAAGGSSGGGDKTSETSLYQTRPGLSLDNDGLEYEVHVVDKKVVDDKKSEQHINAGFKRSGGGGLRDVSQVASEIKIQFERASASGQEIAMLLEVGKLPYHRKHVAKMLQGVTPSLSVASSMPSTSRSSETSSSTDKADPANVDIDDNLVIRPKNLSSTLHKLYLWEKKLYNEVKAEEKLRVVHERKCRKLKHLDERGDEAHKVEATRTLIRSLSTKIRIGIQVVDKISININKIRDEELWPQLNQLIKGFTKMWKSMLECHQCQCQAIKEAKGLVSMGSGKKLGDDHLTATLKLEHDLLSWTSSFSSWVGSQKGYVRALNNWLGKCLLYEPEETADGIAPFSPGRIGAPPVFVICNQWAQAMDMISEKEVIDAMRSFASSVLKLWEQDKQEMRQRMMMNKDLERKVRNLDKQDQRIHKEIQALDKKIVLVAGDAYSLSVNDNIIFQSDTGNSSLQGSLQRIFEAMRKFMAESTKAYEDIIQRTEEERFS